MSGPRFLKLSAADQGVIKKLRSNLSHPTAERLSTHLKEQKAGQRMVDGALDYLCPSCAERRPPALNPPGVLREAKDFNHRVYLDGFDWKSASGYQGYVVHVVDDATQFHQGRRTIRGATHAQKIFEDCWQSWAGVPTELVLECGGEFVSEQWKSYLQEAGIKPILTAGPWQRGRIERHGSTLKEMLSRVDAEIPITSDSEFERALAQCLRAKNDLSHVSGYSPEQNVLGKSSRLPASIMSDEDECRLQSTRAPKRTVSAKASNSGQRPERLSCSVLILRRSVELFCGNLEATSLSGSVVNHVWFRTRGNPLTSLRKASGVDQLKSSLLNPRP